MLTSNYTTKLYNIMESISYPEIPKEELGKYYVFNTKYSLDYLPTIIENSKDIILNKNTTFFDDDFRNDFWRIFCNRNYDNEIEYDSVYKFIAKLNAVLQSILPRYNELYRTSKIKYDILTDRKENQNRINTHTGNTKNTTASTQDNKGQNKTILEDTPSSKLQDLDYASEINTTTSTNNIQHKLDADIVDEYEDKEIRTITGTYNTPSFLIKEYRENLIDIILQLCKEVEQVVFIKIF